MKDIEEASPRMAKKKKKKVTHKIIASPTETSFFWDMGMNKPFTWGRYSSLVGAEMALNSLRRKYSSYEFEIKEC